MRDKNIIIIRVLYTVVRKSRKLLKTARWRRRCNAQQFVMLYIVIIYNVLYWQTDGRTLYRGRWARTSHCVMFTMPPPIVGYNIIININIQVKVYLFGRRARNKRPSGETEVFELAPSRAAHLSLGDISLFYNT